MHAQHLALKTKMGARWCGGSAVLCLAGSKGSQKESPPFSGPVPQFAADPLGPWREYEQQDCLSGSLGCLNLLAAGSVGCPPTSAQTSSKPPTMSLRSRKGCGQIRACPLACAVGYSSVLLHLIRATDSTLVFFVALMDMGRFGQEPVQSGTTWRKGMCLVPLCRLIFGRSRIHRHREGFLIPFQDARPSECPRHLDRNRSIMGV